MAGNRNKQEKLGLIKELVFIKGLSQAEAARQMQVSAVTVNAYVKELRKSGAGELADTMAELEDPEKFLINEIQEHKEAIKILKADLTGCKEANTRVRIIAEIRNERNDYKKCLQDLGIIRQKKDKPKKDKVEYISRLGKDDIPAVPEETAIPPEKEIILNKQEEGQNEGDNEVVVDDNVGVSTF